MNALLNCLTTWRLCLHISLPPQSTFDQRVAYVAGQVISLSNCVGSVAHIMARLGFFPPLLTQPFPGRARFYCLMILCLKLNFGRTMLVLSKGKIYWEGSVRFQPELAPACAMLPIQPAAVNLSLNLS